MILPLSPAYLIKKSSMIGVTTASNPAGSTMTGVVTAVGLDRYRVDYSWTPYNIVYAAVFVYNENHYEVSAVEPPSYPAGFQTTSPSPESGSYYFNVPAGERWYVWVTMQNNTNGVGGVTVGNKVWVPF